MAGPSLFASPRLGLINAQIQHADRHALLHLSYARVFVEDGDVKATSAGSPQLPPGEYAIPYQGLSLLMLGPGTSITQDALRILARGGVGIVAVGEEGTRSYSAPPWGAARSLIARQHARLWADEKKRLEVARRMYALRFGEVLPHRDIEVLRGIEGARVKKTYDLLAAKFGIDWHGRKFDRATPGLTDLPNQAINYTVTCVEAAAEIAVYTVGAIPALGFIHEDAATAFTLDITDLYRAELTIPVAFGSVKAHAEQRGRTELETLCRHTCVREFRRTKLIARMIDRVKVLLEVAEAKA